MRPLIGSVYAALVVLLLAVPARSGDCRRAVVVSQAHYVAPVQVQVYDPHNVAVQAYAVKYLVPLASYTSVGDEARSLYFAREVAKELHALSQGQSQPPATPMPAASSGGAALRIGAVLKDRCVACHAAGKQAPDLSGNPDDVSELVRLKAFHAVATNAMPQGKPPLDQESLNLFAQWSGSPVAAPKK